MTTRHGIHASRWILTAIGIGIFVGSLVIAWIEMGWRKP